MALVVSTSRSADGRPPSPTRVPTSLGVWPQSFPCVLGSPSLWLCVALSEWWYREGRERERKREGEIDEEGERERMRERGRERVQYN